jgi:hypothetical protein
VKDLLTKVNIFGLFAGFVSVVVGFDYVYKEYLLPDGSNEDALVWAFTVALGFLGFFGLLNYCLFAQSIMQDEINRMCVVKERLESALLTNKRRSSKNTKKGNKK